eukprot:GEMP01007298.1.p1 GENE.GEMP01007298.1~~GEMP01007298.1.p1  ORF type:complete len:708 (+),score=187.83 GEMP01007298.1:185-2125(+)
MLLSFDSGLLPIERREERRLDSKQSSEVRSDYKAVHWDEETIAEHDLERGTRQKIDEPDTPFVHSPATTSDTDEFSENLPSTDEDNDDKQQTVKFDISKRNKKPFTNKDSKESANPAAVAERLNEWMLDKKNQESGEATPDSRAPQRRLRRKISLVADDEPKSSSTAFQKKREQHYKEMACMARAIKKGDQLSKNSSDSEGSSDADKKVVTNTNTNINQGPLAVKRTHSRRNKLERPQSSTSFESDEVTGSAAESERSEQSERSDRLESSSFVERRKKHYDEGSSVFRVVVGQVRTNTNTNINASVKRPIHVAEPNPMEAGRPSSVQFPGDSPMDVTEPTSVDEFRRRRKEHCREGEWISSSLGSSDREDDSESTKRKCSKNSNKSVEVVSDLGDSASHSHAFAEKRKKHYNEGEMLKQLRLRMALDPSEDSDTAVSANPSEPNDGVGPITAPPTSVSPHTGEFNSTATPSVPSYSPSFPSRCLSPEDDTTWNSHGSHGNASVLFISPRAQAEELGGHRTPEERAAFEEKRRAHYNQRAQTNAAGRWRIGAEDGDDEMSIASSFRESRDDERVAPALGGNPQQERDHTDTGPAVVVAGAVGEGEAVGENGMHGDADGNDGCVGDEGRRLSRVRFAVGGKEESGQDA